MLKDLKHFASGKKTYLIGVAMIANGLVSLLSSLEKGGAVDSESLRTIFEGLGFIFVRQAISKNY